MARPLQVRAAIPDAQLSATKVAPALVQRIDHATHQAHETPHPYKVKFMRRCVECHLMIRLPSAASKSQTSLGRGYSS